MDINSPNRKAIALLLLVLVLGIALGAVGMTLVNRRVSGARLRRPADPRASGSPLDAGFEPHRRPKQASVRHPDVTCNPSTMAFASK